MQVRISFVIAGLVAVCSSLDADQVVLKNGDRVTGKIMSLGDGTLVVKSD